MTIIELTPAEFDDIIKSSTNSSAKVAGIDLDDFTAKFKNEFSTKIDEPEEETDECETCCCPLLNYIKICGVVVSYDYDAKSARIEAAGVPNAYKVYFVAAANYVNLRIGDTVEVVARIVPYVNGRCNLYVYDPHDVKKLSPKENPSHD